MNSKIFNSIKGNLMGENRLLKFCILVFAIVSIVNSMQIHKAMKMQRTIVLPPDIREKMEFSGDSASASYLRGKALYITSLAFNYTPSNARERFDDLLTMYAPDNYPEAYRMFNELADNIEASVKASSVFHQQQYFFLEKSKKIEVSGVRRIYSEHSVVEDTPKTYVIEYGIEDGRFVIYKLYEKNSGNGGKNA